jgi:predicted helicase
MPDPRGAAALQPRTHQVAGLADLTRALAVHDRTQLVMACGTGKTLVGRWYAQSSEAAQVLVLVPSLGLVAQTVREWRRANRGSAWRFKALVVCSDPTTAEGAAERAGGAEGDAIPVDRGTWGQVDAQVTTQVSRAASWLSGRGSGSGEVRVVFSTYHSSPVVAAAQRQVREFVFDLVVCDEAHRLAGRPSEAFATVLDSRRIVGRKRVFMTATPRVFAGADGASMDDVRLFGPVAHTVTFGEAIAAGLLSDYQVVVVGSQRADSGRCGPLDLVAAATLRAVQEHRLRRLLTFHGGVAKAAAFAAGLDGRTTPSGVRVAARHVSGTMSTAERAAALSWLADQECGGGRGSCPTLAAWPRVSMCPRSTAWSSPTSAPASSTSSRSSAGCSGRHPARRWGRSCCRSRSPTTRTSTPS